MCHIVYIMFTTPCRSTCVLQKKNPSPPVHVHCLLANFITITLVFYVKLLLDSLSNRKLILTVQVIMTILSAMYVNAEQARLHR